MNKYVCSASPAVSASAQDCWHLKCGFEKSVKRFENTVLNQPMLCGDLAQLCFLVSSLCGESLILCAGVKLWFGMCQPIPALWL